MYADTYEYVVTARKKETTTTTTLWLEKHDATLPAYASGQCLTVYFPDLSETLGKQYSISSAPCEGTCAITVKAMGRFSNRLCSLAVGDKIFASTPGGAFRPKRARRVTLLAGGMGITPFRSIIIEALSQAPAVPLRLLYSAKTVADMPFGVELHDLSSKSSSFTIERFVTREFEATSGLKCRRMRADDVLNQRDFKENEYLLSGSLNFVLGLKNILLEAGVGRENILTEAYF